MNSPGQQADFYIGWDVGGWNCDKNGKSRDAIAILDGSQSIVGKPWRGNLRQTINEASDSLDFVRRLFAHCKAAVPVGPMQATLAIDTPLGFSDEFVRLITRAQCVEAIDSSQSNSYLFRETERRLFAAGLSPLSAVKDMIGSQATKGMHVLGKFFPRMQSCGVWMDGASVTALEAYPSACKNSKAMQDLKERVGHDLVLHADESDALVCALIAYLFATDPDALLAPDADVPENEGWIWIPKDVVK